MACQVANWIANWLSDSKQRVPVSGRMSCWEDESSGMPQGSLLGPLLFNIYINDLDSGMKSRLSKFADDTKLGGKVDSRGGGEQIQESIDTCMDWAKDWLMEFNLTHNLRTIFTFSQLHLLYQACKDHILFEFWFLKKDLTTVWTKTASGFFPAVPIILETVQTK